MKKILFIFIAVGLLFAGTLTKLTYTNKTNVHTVNDRTKQGTAEDFNDIKSVVNAGLLKVDTNTTNIAAHETRLDDLERGCFGGIWLSDGTTAQSIDTGVVYTKSTGFVRAGFKSDGCVVPDSTNDKLTITVAGYYQVNFTVSATSGTNNIIFKAAPFLGGVEQENIHVAYKIGTGADMSSGSAGGVIRVLTVPVDLDMRFRHDYSSAVNITPVYMNLMAHKVGDL